MKVSSSTIANSFSAPLARSAVKVLFAVLISLVLLFLMAQPVAACEITITPDAASGHVGDILTFTIDVRKTHRTCTVPIEETVINLRAMEIVSQTPWQQISSDVNRREITVRLTEVGKGQIEVIRECPKGGDTCIASVTIEEAAAPTTPPTPPTPLPPTPTTPPSEPTPIPEPSPAPAPSEPTWGSAFKDSISQPPIIAVGVFTILGVIGLIKGYRRFRYFILLASIAYLGFIIGGCPCPLGALQNIILNSGGVKERLASYLLLGIPVIAAILFGRVFCGWVCPWGAVQNFLYKKETGKKAKKFDVGPRLHNVLRYGKYVSLVALIIATILTQTRVYESIDPFKALFNLQLVLIPTSILVVLMITSLFMGFPWCKYVCPLGAFLSLFSRFTLFKVKIGDKCTNCKACHMVFCDYKAIKPGEVKPEINQLECTRCGECISRCPYNAMEFTMRRHAQEIDRVDKLPS